MSHFGIESGIHCEPTLAGVWVGPQKTRKNVIFNILLNLIIILHCIFYYKYCNLRWEAVRRTVGLSQKVYFLQKRSAKIYVFAFSGLFATFLAKTTLLPPFRPDRGPTLRWHHAVAGPYRAHKKILCVTHKRGKKSCGTVHNKTIFGDFCCFGLCVTRTVRVTVVPP